MKRILAYTPVLKKELRSYLAAKKATMAVSWGDDFLERLEPYATGGKLLRGSALCFAYETFSGRPAGRADRAVINAAMALELAHSALLIHDDIMDEDDTRRGQPAMHHQYRLAAEKTGLRNGRQYGGNLALAGGDAALFLAFELLTDAQSRYPGNSAFHLFASQLLTTCFGQMQDIYLEAAPGMPSKQAIYELMESKTAAYTLALPLAMGGALAGQPEPVIEQLQALGTAAGTIFQIRDDELGAMGDPAKTGKPVGADIKEGKKTLFYYYLVQHSSAKERKLLGAIFGQAAASEQDIAYVQQLARQKDIPAILDKAIRQLESRALQCIEGLGIAANGRRELASLVAFCANRTS